MATLTDISAWSATGSRRGCVKHAAGNMKLVTGKRETNSPGMKFGMLIPRVSEFLARIVARLAQSAERKALNLVVVGSSPTVGDCSSCAAHTNL